MSSSLLKKINILYRKICMAYIKGEIAYPRVGHDYIVLQELKFYEYPHPPLEEFDEYSTPLENDSYILNKKTLPLWLTHKNIATPATLIENYHFLDKFISDTFQLREIVEKKDLEYKLELLMEEMIENNKVSIESDMLNGFFDKSIDLDMLFDIDFDLREKEDEKKLSSILSLVSADGTIQTAINTQITPYSILLEPDLYSHYIQENYNNENNDEIVFVSERKDLKEYPSSPKININPLENYSFDTVKKTIKVKEISHLLDIEERINLYKTKSFNQVLNKARIDNINQKTKTEQINNI